MHQKNWETERFLPPAEAAGILTVSIDALKKWRKAGTGPPYYRLQNGRVRYMERELLIWMNSQRRPGGAR